MKYKLAAFFALIGWFAIITQYILMIETRETTILETTIKFFSFFTILTNSLVAIYFTCIVIYKNKMLVLIAKPGTLTALTVYILIVGLVYQFALRHLWNPTGLQRVVDELLHSVIPILVLIFWYLYETKQSIKYAYSMPCAANWAFAGVVSRCCLLHRVNTNFDAARFPRMLQRTCVRGMAPA